MFVERRGRNIRVIGDVGHACMGVTVFQELVARGFQNGLTFGLYNGAAIAFGGCFHFYGTHI